jgi:ATP-dependent helicase/nuclease subunit A
VKEIIQDPLQRVDVAHFAEVWKNRAEKRQAFEETRRVITPTSLQRRTPWNSNQDENGIRPYATRELGSHSSAAHLGTLVHLFLEKWDFTCEKCSMPALLTRLANAYFAQEGLLARLLPDPKEGLLKLEKDDPMSEVVAIVAEAQRLLADFIDSDDYDEIKNGKILGREVPFFYSLKEASLMRGVMDILYENPDGSWVVGDYKTDRKPPTEETYAAQGNVYKEAVKRALGKDVLFKVIPLRQNSIA